MKILVLGSSGVIGTALVQNLRSKNHNVLEFDIKNGPEEDLRISGVLDNILGDVEFVFFLAFDVGGSKYPINSAEYISNNMRLIENTFTSLAKFKTPFIHTTSQMSNMHHNPYGVLKRIAEFYTNYLDGINVKVWNVYGPEEVGPKSHVVNDFIEQALKNKEIRVMTTGEETRQFLHGNDFAEAVYVLMNSYKKYSGLTIDISSFEWVSIIEVANIVAKLCGPEVNVFPGKAESSFQTHVNEPNWDIRKAGWKPIITLSNGISEILNNRL
jgi:nucleoside-diphosphate-sugar epimerase